MHIRFQHRYTYRDEIRALEVAYDDGAVTVTDHVGDVHRLTYADGKIVGSGSLAQSHRTAIAAHIAANLAVVLGGLV